MNLFGKALFEKKAPNTLYDFAQHGLTTMQNDYGLAYVEIGTPVTIEQQAAAAEKALKKKPKKEVPKPTPKELYQLKTLNIPEFTINCDLGYLTEQVEILEHKQALLGKPRKRKTQTPWGEPAVTFEGGPVGYGQQEVASMIERMGHRRRYPNFEKQYSDYPYTSNDAVRELLNNHKHLEIKNAASSIPDLPSDAIKTMKHYTEATQQLCGKDPVFYLIAEKKERAEVMRRRDPILLAQSPFGFFWQILGAWDKEVVFLDEL